GDRGVPRGRRRRASGADARLAAVFAIDLRPLCGGPRFGLAAAFSPQLAHDAAEVPDARTAHRQSDPHCDEQPGEGGCDPARNAHAMFIARANDDTSCRDTFRCGFARCSAQCLRAPRSVARELRCGSDWTTLEVWVPKASK